MTEPAAPLPDPLRAVATAMFGLTLPLAERYAELLATDGVLRGLMGPREAPRMWDRHLLNCAALAPLLSNGALVLDVGSGAGLPGIVLGIARPDLDLVLIEPLSRRVTFLTEVVSELGLDKRVRVVRGRAEEIAARPTMFHVKPADIVTARAVAPLDRLTGWCLPLCAIEGRMLVMKGSSAAAEVVEHAPAIRRLGGGMPVVHRCSPSGLDPTYVVEIVRERELPARPKSSKRRR